MVAHLLLSMVSLKLMTRNRSPSAYIPFASCLVRQSMKSIQMKKGAKRWKGNERRELLLPPCCTCTITSALTRAFIPTVADDPNGFFLSHPFMRRRLNNLLPGLVLFGMMRTFRMDWPLKIFDGAGSRSWLNTRNWGYVFVQTQSSHSPLANSAEFDIRLGRKSTQKTKLRAQWSLQAGVGRMAISN